LLEHAVQLKVRVERHDDLVLEDALVFQVEARRREAQGSRPLCRRRDEPSGSTARTGVRLPAADRGRLLARERQWVVPKRERAQLDAALRLEEEQG